MESQIRIGDVLFATLRLCGMFFILSGTIAIIGALWFFISGLSPIQGLAAGIPIAVVGCGFAGAIQVLEFRSRRRTPFFSANTLRMSLFAAGWAAVWSLVFLGVVWLRHGRFLSTEDALVAIFGSTIVACLMSLLPVSRPWLR